MAADKKSFVLYADLQHTVKHLTDEQAGNLFKHILSYVNDESPVTDNPITKIAFEPIKQQLKRDLDKWGTTKEGRSKAGKASAEARRLKREQELTNSTNVKNVKQTSTNPTVNDNVNVNVNVNDTVNVNVINKDKEVVFSEWIGYRKEIKKPIKAKKTLNSLIDQFNKATLKECEFAVTNSINNQWTGLFWDKFKEQSNKETKKPWEVNVL